jgi:histidinol-phosphate/aromatic aminotransferase/cobyric acid decarboxylase-like protein/choline kinase
MRPLTDETHKTLLPIAGTTILDRLLSSLRDCGVRDVCIVTGYRADQIERTVAERFGDLNVQYVHNAQYETTNNVFSMALALESMPLDDDIVLIESDLIVDHRVIEQIVNTPYANAALVDHYRVGMDGTVVTIGTDNVITQVHPSYLQDDKFNLFDKYKTLNIYKFDKGFAQTVFRDLLSFYSRSIDSSCYYELLLGVLIYMRSAVVHAERVHHPWAEVDDPNDLAVAEFEFNKSARRPILESSWGGSWNLSFTDFYFIRNSYFPTAAVIAEMRGSLDVVMGQYGSAQAVLNRKISYFQRCEQKRIFLLNGASQFYPVLRSLFPAAPALVPTPTFGEYNRIFPGARTYIDHGHIDLDEVKAGVPGREVVVVVNPNNPTGTVVPTAEVYDLARSFPTTVFLVDESFIDFSDQPSIISYLEQAPLDNVIVLKSLSKSLGVPGLRIGFVYTSRQAVMDALWDHTPIWNVNAMAEHFIELILKHRDALERSFVRVAEDRASFVRMLEAVPVVDEVMPSGGDFLAVKLHGPPEQADTLAEALMERYSFHVKDVSARFPDQRGYFRLAVRRPEENDALCQALTELTPVAPRVAVGRGGT